jgi:hypothetical protein
VSPPRTLISFTAALLFICSLPGCATDGACLDASTAPEQVRSIYIVKRGGHTGIAIASADWPDRNWSLLADFPGSDYLEFGWGDELFYQAEPETVWLGTRAAENIYADDVVEVRVSADGLRRMAEAIQREFTERTPVATPVSLRAAPKPNHFYGARRKFYFPRMCNWWIASRLEEANCPILPWTVVTAARIMREARSFGSTER